VEGKKEGFREHGRKSSRGKGLFPEKKRTRFCIGDHSRAEQQSFVQAGYWSDPHIPGGQGRQERLIVQSGKKKRAPRPFEQFQRRKRARRLLLGTASAFNRKRAMGKKGPQRFTAEKEAPRTEKKGMAGIGGEKSVF